MSQDMHTTWRLLVAFERAEMLPDKARSKVIAALIERLAMTPHSAAA